MKKISGFKLIGGIESMGIKLPKKEMIVGEIIGKHKIIALSADTNVGKSIWAHQLGLAVAVGMPEIFGYPISGAKRVLFLNFEMDEYELLERQQLLISRIPQSYHKFLDNFQINTFDGKRTLFQDNWDRIEQTIRDNDAFDLIIIDNMYACTGIDDEKNADLKPLLARIISISDIHDSSLHIVTHHKKHDAAYILSTDLIRGGSTFANAVDVIIQLAESLRTPNLRLMKITKNRGKSPNKGKSFGMTLSDDLWFEMIGEVNESYHLSAPAATSEDERVLGALDEIFGTRDFLGKTAELTTASERTGHNRLKSLAKDGVIEKVSHGRFKKTDPVE